MLASLLMLVQPSWAQDDSGQFNGLDPSALDNIQGQVSQLRGLAVLTAPGLQVVSSNDLGQHLLGMYQDQQASVSPNLIHAAQDFQKLMSFTSRPRAPMVTLPNSAPNLAVGIAGLYIPEEKTIYLVSNDGSLGDFEVEVFAHEFTHALQDQHFDMFDTELQLASNPDREAAYHALLEGDATLTEEQWAAQELDPSEVAQFGVGWEEAAVERVGLYPYSYQTAFQFLYGAGTRLVRQAYERGDAGFAAIDQLYKDLPASTAQVLHPERYWAHEMPLDVMLPDVPSQLGPSWSALVTSVYGELGLQFLIQLSSPPQTAAAAVSGWRGDRIMVLEHNGQPALLFRSTWESSTRARQFFDTFAFRLRRQFADAEVEFANTTRLSVQADGEAADLRLNGSDVLLALGPDRATSDILVGVVGGF